MGRHKTHGGAVGGKLTPEYSTWREMKWRCYAKWNLSYGRYGGRGITVCDRWLEPNGAGYLNFLADLGKRPNGKTLERIDNMKGYSPENCRWATVAEQNRNKRNNRLLTINGKTQCFNDWAKELGMNPNTLRNRIDYYGWSVERAITEVVGPSNNKWKHLGAS